MNKQDFMDWIMSLNPIVIDVDEEGNPTDESQLDTLSERIKSEVNNIQEKSDE